MKNRGSTLILSNLVGVHPMNIHTKSVQRFEKRSGKTKKVHANNDDDGHSLIASHTHSLSVTKNYKHSKCDILNLDWLAQLWIVSI